MTGKMNFSITIRILEISKGQTQGNQVRPREIMRTNPSCYNFLKPSSADSVARYLPQDPSRHTVPGKFKRRPD
ncbi:hypothetical protein CBD41_02355 [bacterium TMED181]|nr:hypothetical protein [Planctomycetota bacterium]OUW46606.1 MAG: hypothetical protein CBD41_02355 [bacterium TMED181]